MPPDMVRNNLEASRANNYEFSSEDGKSKINLTKNYLSLSHSEYSRWQKFTDDLSESMQALVDIYTPIHFSRIGLRYIDVIRRAKLGLSNVPWVDLLEPQIAGLLGPNGLGDNLINSDTRSEIRLSDGTSVVRLRLKLTPEGDGSDENFVIDSDFFTNENTPIENATDMLNYFNLRASRLFQWAITSRLHDAMNPRSI